MFMDDFEKKFTSCIKKPDEFVSASANLIDNIKELVKDTYDFTKSEEDKSASEALPELIVQKFDIEQIWQQVELQNNSYLTESLNSICRLVAAKERLWFLNDNIQEDDYSDDEQSENEISNAENSKQVEKEDDVLGDSDDDSNNEVVLQSDNEKQNVIKSKINQKSWKKSIVDDDFFKLDEMEKFLRNEEKSPKKTKESNNEDDDTDEEEDSVDLFENNDDDDSENESAANPKYDDFFNDSTEADRDEDMEDEENEEEMDIDEEVNDTENLKSNLELREERLKKKIEELENSALQEKPWQLKGEISATNRPQNSLLEEVVEFDLTSRPAPIITEETTLRLEDIIKQRIKDKAWNDVERKQKFVETPSEYRKKLVLDQEKSKQSLAQIYEDEYLKQKEALDPDAADKPDKEPEEHIEIRAMMKKLFSKLDALSNFHFTPKPAVPELRVVNNLPAINMEEVAPVAASDAALLAPEEVKKKLRGDLIGKEERTDTDKNRERRQKKLKQRQHAKEKEKKTKMIEKMRPGLGNKYSKIKAAKLLEQVAKDRNVDKMDESGGKIKSSTAFFTQLEEEVKGQIKSKIKTQKKNKPTFTGKKLKL